MAPKKVVLTEEEYNRLYKIDPGVVKTFSYYVAYPNVPKVVSWRSYKDLCKQVPDVKKLQEKETMIPQLCNNMHVSIVPYMSSRYKKVVFNVKGSFEELLRDYRQSLLDGEEWWY
jgi:hypothetical protein